MMGASPAVEGFELTSHDLDPAVLAEYYPPLKKQLNGLIAGPVGLSVKGSGTQEAPGAEPGGGPDAGAPARPGSADARRRGRPCAHLADLRERRRAAGRCASTRRRTWTGADLRPGLLLNKGPGQRLDVAAAGTYQPTKDGMKVDVEASSALNVLEDTLTGTASFALAGKGKKQTTTFAMDMKTPAAERGRAADEGRGGRGAQRRDAAPAVE